MERPTEKKCNKCGEIKPIEDFPRGRGACCRKCKNAYKRSRNPLRREYYKKYNKEYNNLHRETRKEKRRIRDSKNKEKLKKQNADYIAKNRDRLNEIRREKRRSNQYLRLIDTVRKQIRRGIKSGNKKYKTLELLGCTIEEFMEYIAAKFVEGMTWDNYGYETWHLDHIKPIYAFNLDDPEEQKKCFHYTNYQPLWKLDNLKKNKFYTEPTTETQPQQ